MSTNRAHVKVATSGFLPAWVREFMAEVENRIRA